MKLKKLLPIAFCFFVISSASSMDQQDSDSTDAITVLIVKEISEATDKKNTDKLIFLKRLLTAKIKGEYITICEHTKDFYGFLPTLDKRLQVYAESRFINLDYCG